MSKFRLRDECDVILTELKTYFGDKNIVQIDIDPALPNVLEGPSDLLLNSLRAFAQFLASNVVNGIIRIELNAGVGGGASEVVILVIATGSGIPTNSKDQSQLQSEFYSLNTQFTNSLTLITSGDVLRLESAFNQKVSDNKPVKGKNLFKGKRILLAEDNEVNVIVFSSFLEDWGVLKTVAMNGEEAVTSVSLNEFDAILMDIHMPVMDGIEAIRQIRLTKPTIPIIILSAASHKEDIEMAMKMGGNAFLKKPVSSWELYATLVKYIN